MHISHLQILRDPYPSRCTVGAVSPGHVLGPAAALGALWTRAPQPPTLSLLITRRHVSYMLILTFQNSTINAQHLKKKKRSMHFNKMFNLIFLVFKREPLTGCHVIGVTLKKLTTRFHSPCKGTPAFPPRISIRTVYWHCISARAAAATDCTAQKRARRASTHHILCY